MPNSKNKNYWNSDAHLFDGMHLTDVKNDTVMWDNGNVADRAIFRLTNDNGSKAYVTRYDHRGDYERSVRERYTTDKGNMYIDSRWSPNRLDADTVISVPKETLDGTTWMHVSPGDPGYKTHRDLIIDEITRTPSTERPQLPAPSPVPAQRRTLQEALTELDRVQRYISNLRRMLSMNPQREDLLIELNRALRHQGDVLRYINRLANPTPLRKYGGILNYANYFK